MALHANQLLQPFLSAVVRENYNSDSSIIIAVVVMLQGLHAMTLLKTLLHFQNARRPTIKDESALFSLHQGMYATSFSGTLSFHAAANQVNYFHACVHVNVTGETSMLNFTDRESLGLQNGTRCYWLQWTSPWLFSHITVDQLMIFDNVFSKMAYNPYLGHSLPRTTDLRFHHTPAGVSFLFFPLPKNRQSHTQSITGGPHITTLKQSVMCQEVTHVL